MLRRWSTFTRFPDDGRICLTNNATERALRGVPLRRLSSMACSTGGRPAGGDQSLYEGTQQTTKAVRSGADHRQIISAVRPGHQTWRPTRQREIEQNWFPTKALEVQSNGQKPDEPRRVCAEAWNGVNFSLLGAKMGASGRQFRTKRAAPNPRAGIIPRRASRRYP
jgi:hypothetical protein